MYFKGNLNKSVYLICYLPLHANILWLSHPMSCPQYSPCLYSLTMFWFVSFALPCQISITHHSHSIVTLYLAHIVFSTQPVCWDGVRGILSTGRFLMSKQSPPSPPTATLHRKDSPLVGSTKDVTNSKWVHWHNTYIYWWIASPPLFDKKFCHQF